MERSELGSSSAYQWQLEPWEWFKFLWKSKNNNKKLRASHTHMDPEDELESVRLGGQSIRKMGSAKVQSER